MFTGDLQGFEMLLTLVGLLLIFRLLGRYGVISSKKDAENGEVERACVRFVPDSIETLMEMTGFDKTELKSLYRKFKNECPHGMISEEQFKVIYGQFFPNGDSDMYAHFVFRTFDVQNQGFVTFQQFVLGLATLLRGTLMDRLQWTFHLYDLNGNGFITRDDIHKIVKSIYMLLEKDVEPEMTEENYRYHADQVFSRIDHHRNGSVSLEEFCEACKENEFIVGSMKIFDGTL